MEGTGESRICCQRVEYRRLRFAHGLTGILCDLARKIPEGCYSHECRGDQPVWWSTYASEGLSALEKWRSQEPELGETSIQRRCALNVGCARCSTSR